MVVIEQEQNLNGAKRTNFQFNSGFVVFFVCFFVSLCGFYNSNFLRDDIIEQQYQVNQRRDHFY